MRGVVAMAMAFLVASSGCAATVDATYLLGDGRYTRSASESRPLAQTIDRIEYEAAVEPDGTMRVACFARTRQVQRTWHVVKTYRYRGGYGKQAYLATAIGDVLFGALVAGTFLGICRNDETDVSCWNMLYATPFALDLGYSLIRYATARTPILIDKSSTQGTLGLVAEPLHEQATACESLASLWLGSATGPDDVQILLGHAGDADTRALAQGAIELALDPTHTIALTPEVAERWALFAGLGLFAVDRDGVPHSIAVDRCALLRPLSASLSADAQTAYQQQCGTRSNAATEASTTAQ